MTRRIPHADTEVRQAFQKLTKRSDVLTTGTSGYLLFGAGVGVTPTWAAISSVDHGGLGGLGDDDHTIYLLASGARALTGALDLGTNLINNVVDPLANQDAATKKYVDDNIGVVTDELVGVDSGATAGYLGAAAGDGVLRTSTGLSYADGGNFVTLTTNDGQIVHDNLSGYAANDHIDHTGVTLTAGSGIAGGGDISTSRSFDLDINSLSAATIAAGDFIPFWDITATATNKKITFANFEGLLDHGSLAGTGDDDHTIYLLADGSRDLTGNLAVDAEITIDGRDISADGTTLDTIDWLTVGTGLDLTGTTLSTEDSEIVHGDLSGYDANEHIDHTSVDIATAATSGVSGGGDISSTRNLALNINGLTGESGIVAADTLAFYDNGVGNRKVTFAEFSAALAGGGADVKVGVDSGATADYLGAANSDGCLRTGTGLGYADGGNFVTLTLSHLGIESLTDPGADRIMFWDDVGAAAVTWLTVGSGLSIATTTLALDINGLNADTIVAGDSIAFYDTTGGACDKTTFANFEAALTHANLIGGHNLTTDIDHNALTNYAANEHINWTAASDNLTTTGNITCRNSGSDIATLGGELLTNGTFASDLSSWTIGDAGAEWVWDATGKADHATGNTSTFFQGVSLTDTETYYVEFTVSGRTAGSVVLTFGALVGSYTASTDGTYQCSFRATSTASFNLTFTPVSTFNGMLDDVTVKQITGTSGSIVTLEDNTGADAIEIRSSYALQNTFVGLDCGHYNMVGDYNTAFGYYALYNNTTGQNNFAVGAEASYSNTTGDDNVAVGYRALFLSTIANGNIAIGSKALRYSTTGFQNVAIGYEALYSNTIGFGNVAIGYGALISNEEGNYNSAIGGRALFNNEDADDNTAIGYYALYTNTLGYDNVGIGNSALYSTLEGFRNTAIGKSALNDVTSGDLNVGIGWAAGDGLTTGNKNTIIGSVLGVPAALSNYVVIGDGDGNQRIVVDNSGNVGIGLPMTDTIHYPLTVDGGIAGLEKSADPAEPAEGEFVIWMSDGTGKGDDGDVMIASKAAGQANVGTLLDHSGGAAW